MISSQSRTLAVELSVLCDISNVGSILRVEFEGKNRDVYFCVIRLLFETELQRALRNFVTVRWCNERSSTLTPESSALPDGIVGVRR